MKRVAPFDPRPAWMQLAECAYVDPELWFPHEKGDPGVAAKRICRRCPVQAECLEYALVNNEMYGIWGGKSWQERTKLKRAAR